MASACPGMSSRRPSGFRDSGKIVAVSARASAPTGTITKKMLRHPATRTRRPPDGRADHESKAIAARPYADCLCALLCVGISNSQDRERCRHQESGAKTGERAAGDEEGRIGRRGAQQRANDKDRSTRGKNPTSAIKIAERAGGQQQAAIDEVVRVHHPLQRPHTDPELGADLPQRQIDDRGIELRHQHGKARGDENETARCVGHERRGGGVRNHGCVHCLSWSHEDGRRSQQCRP
jgi:hypothetical protein